MSRAFVKEPDGDQADTDLPERPQSGLPNYISPTGLARLNDRLGELSRERDALKADDSLAAKNRLKPVEQELRYWQQRVQAAIPIDPATQPADAIRFGATVDLLGEDNKKYTFTIVGEDEADPANNRISWASPLAKALMGKQIDDVVIWERPNGELELEIAGFEYRNR
ncbi:MAG: GreA/GreB family elongation factor [Gammaproteobacteria bacterium]